MFVWMFMQVSLYVCVDVYMYRCGGWVYLVRNPFPIHHLTTKSQLQRMDRALGRPTNMLDALRLAHRLRPGTAAPPHWQPGLAGLDFLPPSPFMPVNECIAASRLRRHSLEVQRQNRGAFLSYSCV